MSLINIGCVQTWSKSDSNPIPSLIFRKDCPHCFQQVSKCGRTDCCGNNIREEVSPSVACSLWHCIIPTHTAALLRHLPCSWAFVCSITWQLGTSNGALSWSCVALSDVPVSQNVFVHLELFTLRPISTAAIWNYLLEVVSKGFVLSYDLQKSSFNLNWLEIVWTHLL